MSNDKDLPFALYEADVSVDFITRHAGLLAEFEKSFKEVVSRKDPEELNTLILIMTMFLNNTAKQLYAELHKPLVN